MTPPPSLKFPQSFPLTLSEPDVSSPPSPPLAQSSPEQQDTPLETINVTTHVIRHGSPDSSQELPHSNMINIDEEKEERTNSPSTSESWSSLPQHRDGGRDHDPPKVDGNRVEQLTMMVEKLSAKFILLETHLKLSQSQVGHDAGMVEPPHGYESSDVRNKVEDMKLPLTREQSLSQSPGSPMKHVTLREKPSLQTELAHDQLPSVQRNHIHQQSSYTSHSLNTTPSTPVWVLADSVTFDSLLSVISTCRRKPRD